jgi:heme/copper-type cytochrome/quinol oxidase subunit 4
LVIIDSANASPTGKISSSYSLIIFSSLALIPYLLVAEETLASQTVGVLLFGMIQIQLHQGSNHLLLDQKPQPHQGLIQLLINQTSKSPSSSLKNFLPPLGKPEMM